MENVCFVRVCMRASVCNNLAKIFMYRLGRRASCARRFVVSNINNVAGTYDLCCCVCVCGSGRFSISMQQIYANGMELRAVRRVCLRAYKKRTKNDMHTLRSAPLYVCANKTHATASTATNLHTSSRRKRASVDKRGRIFNAHLWCCVCARHTIPALHAAQFRHRQVRCAALLRCAMTI